MRKPTEREIDLIGVLVVVAYIAMFIHVPNMILFVMAALIMAALFFGYVAFVMWICGLWEQGGK
jgi:hypothetical protein